MFNFISTTQWIFNRIWSREGQPHIVKLSFVLWLRCACECICFFVGRWWFSVYRYGLHIPHTISLLPSLLRTLSHSLSRSESISAAVLLPLLISLYFSLDCDKYCQCRANTSEGMQNCFVSLCCTKNRRTDFCIFTTDHVMLSSSLVSCSHALLLRLLNEQKKKKQTNFAYVCFIYLFPSIIFYLSYTDSLSLSLSLPGRCYIDWCRFVYESDILH